MCIDNPREGFSNLFATHPSVEARVEALVKFAGGHDPGPLALEAPEPRPLHRAEPPALGPRRADRARRQAVLAGRATARPRGGRRTMGPRRG